ncbi:hypothetical protein [Subtercola boreus]|uniref:Uncharacterized protein n=1 Tax=Subtercola boreus TaxID=120213 RepID=A0A3E0WDA2_9MICO|nr:hypothetical protein [Subtercola boreus]RFA21068.1 hypothetical protein B7R24_06585 [Subtercola boreus]RFA21452.1 hypothetical protein B7R23_06530 [Subtercola boreus]RFA27423.1 hypothetical protein B7R25_06655 [Subtercola boreus]
MKSVPATLAVLVVAAALVVANSSAASANSVDFGSQVCGFGGPAAASTAYVSATSVHYHQANGVSWSSRTFGSGFHRFSSGNGVVAMQISYPAGTETGRAFSCADGSF